LFIDFAMNKRYQKNIGPGRGSNLFPSPDHSKRKDRCNG